MRKLKKAACPYLRKKGIFEYSFEQMSLAAGKKVKQKMRHFGTHTTLMDAMFTETRTYNFEMAIKVFGKVYGSVRQMRGWWQWKV